MTDNYLLLYRLAELMLKHEQHLLPVDLLFDDEQIGVFVKSIQIDSPYQQMLMEGVLTESVLDEKLYVGFTVEGYFHYVLGEVIFNQTKGQSAEALKIIIEENKLKGAKEGVEQCLIKDVQNDDLKRLMWLIDIGGSILDVCSVPLASAFIFINVNPKTFKQNKKLIIKRIDFVIDVLFEKQTINDIDVLTKAIKRLKSLSKYNIIGYIYNRILELIKIENLKSVDLLLDSHIYSKRKILLSKVKLIEQLINECKNDKDKGLTYLSLAEYYLNNSNYKKSEKYYKKAQNLCSFDGLDYIFDGLSTLSLNNDLLDDALSYANYSFSYRINKYGLNSIKIADSYFLLGRIWDSYGYRQESEIVKNGFFTKAIENYFKSIEIAKKHVGNYHESVATIYDAIGNSYKCISLFSDAIDNLQISLKIVKEIDGEKAFKVADLKSDIADILISINRKEEAIILLQDSYDIFKKLGVKNIFATSVLEMINEIKNDI